MALTIAPVASPAGTSLTTALQPGTVVDARVLQILESGLTRILIAGVALDIASTANLTAGTNVQLAVSQTPQGIQLAVVGQGAAATSSVTPGARSPSPAVLTQGADEGRGNAVITPATSNAATNISAASSPILSPAVAPVVSADTSPAAILRSVVANATETAASNQASLAPLFANVDAVAAARPLPPAVAAAAERLLALRPDLGAALQGEDIKTAFKSSGLFLESTLKAATLTGTAAPSATVPDMKAALLVLRQVLSLWSDGSPESVVPTPSPAAQGALKTVATETAISNDAKAEQAAATNSITPAPAKLNVPGADEVGKAVLAVEIPVEQQSTSEPLRQSVVQATVASDEPVIAPATMAVLAEKAATMNPADVAVVAPRMVAVKVGDVVASELLAIPDAPSLSPDTVTRNAPPSARDAPPPPWRGAAPSAQPIASPTLAPSAPDSNVARTLLHETDAALARQTLHQIASLPDSAGTASSSSGVNSLTANQGPHWSFEIPFATPQGTAVAQFEISGDGGGENAEARPQKVWRARFTIDLESVGPVHARVAMIAQPNAQPKTSVRLWAERPETQKRLQSGADQLTQALRNAQLEPETIIIGEGKPPANPIPSGRFLNRAS